MQIMNKRKRSWLKPNTPILRFPPIHKEERLTVTTREAAFHLGRTQQTLRYWACKGVGPIEPMRINGRLAWPVPDIKRALGLYR